MLYPHTCRLDYDRNTYTRYNYCAHCRNMSRLKLLPHLYLSYKEFLRSKTYASRYSLILLHRGLLGTLEFRSVFLRKLSISFSRVAASTMCKFVLTVFSFALVLREMEHFQGMPARPCEFDPVTIPNIAERCTYVFENTLTFVGSKC